MLSFGVTFIVKNDNANVAYVYYENKLIKIIDLSNDELKEYTIKGYNGDVIIETKRIK